MRSLVPLLWAAACTPPGPQQTTPVPTDSDTSEPKILPIDTAPFIPIDSSADGPPDLVPGHFVYMSQSGVWNLSSASAPNTMTGSLQITEYVDTLDTALPEYECYVTYALTGEAVGNHTCTDCNFVFDVEFYVDDGDPAACHDPDAPPSGAVWQMGWSDPDGTIYLNYYGTDVWLPWYPGTKSAAVIDFAWSATLAIEVLDTGDMQ
ncbi:MAG: hypothetical protein R3F59_12260 [Myxococcota bacterium]